jgi:GH15 family glucan-1,4-alpha-glucosidase
MPCRIEDYALIGDCETAALVGRNGSIDWLCWPRFDGGACFAALLGAPENGRWLIAPADSEACVQRRYRGNTLILETEFAGSDGVVTLVDFMPPRGKASDVVRLIIGRRGKVRMRTELVMRFDYGAQVPWVSRGKDGALFAVAGPDLVVLRTPAILRGEERRTIGEFTVSAGETIPFVLTYGASHLPPPEPIDPMAALADTETFWNKWSARFHGAGPWSEAVIRSLITLKALTYRPTGGIVAAPTSSLPEQLGGSRNWDYRYCWLRDATFTMLALMNSGYYDEARDWRAWLLRAAAGDAAQLQSVYGLAGERHVGARQADWLPGYEGSRPVHIGNTAMSQLQLDVYGEVMDTLHQGRAGKLGGHDAGWALQRELLKHLEAIWQQPDRGIWEMRGEPRQFTYSKVMAWVAFDRAVKSAERFALDGPVERWRAVRAEIHEQVCRNGYDVGLGAFVQSYGSPVLDASALLFPLVGFLPASDARVRATIAAIERNLLRDGLVRRYDTQRADDNLPGGEGAFLACSFWLADNLILQGRDAEARRLFEHLLSLRNDLGLLSEEYAPSDRRLVGNFPQALSHIALINTAGNLGRAAGAKPRAHRHQP